MAGNVWQWVEDCWYDNYKDAPKDGSAVQNGTCTLRVLRGGSWFDFPQNLRAAYRYYNYPFNRDNYFGFRVARTITP
jgi:formylglycine-generating enzyme required for sulfatase activity